MVHRTVRWSRTAIVTFAAAVGVAAVPSHAAVAACWSPPVAAPVSDPYREPACRWCPGNRGIEYDTRPGQSVVAVETGRVTFAGQVAGTTYVVIEHRDGRRVTYGRLRAHAHDRGDLVRRGQVVGTAGESFHFGVRVGERYIDPDASIGRLVGRPRLVPADGSPAPATAPVLRCEGTANASTTGANGGRRR